jgi:hypothetical protein
MAGGMDAFPRMIVGPVHRGEHVSRLYQLQTSPAASAYTGVPGSLVDSDDALTAIEQAARNVVSDEAGRAGHENRH